MRGPISRCGVIRHEGTSGRQPKPTRQRPVLPLHGISPSMHEQTVCLKRDVVVVPCALQAAIGQTGSPLARQRRAHPVARASRQGPLTSSRCTISAPPWLPTACQWLHLVMTAVSAMLCGVCTHTCEKRHLSIHIRKKNSHVWSMTQCLVSEGLVWAW